MGDIKIITSWKTLMVKAKALGNARKLSDAKAIDKAKKEFDEYKDLCLRSEEMLLESEEKIIKINKGYLS